MIYLVLLLPSILFFTLYLRARAQAKHTIEQNSRVQQENQELEQANQNLKDYNLSLENQKQELRKLCADEQQNLAAIKSTIAAQENIYRSYQTSNERLEQEIQTRTKTLESDSRKRAQQLEQDARERAQKIEENAKEYANKLQQDAEQRAQQSYEAAAARLTQEYETRKQALEAQYQSDSSLLLKKLQIEQEKLKDLENKQFAYIQAKQREEEMEAKRDYYRPVITDNDIEEIKVLRNLQLSFSHKEAIDKLIWEVYYKGAYDLLMAHIISQDSTNCGIYKLTNTVNGQAYIGQSVSLRDRLKTHIKTGLSSGNSTNKLYQQMKKYGVHNFTFEILEEVPRDKLNEREIYWIEFYKTRELGMNSTRGGA